MCVVSGAPHDLPRDRLSLELRAERDRLGGLESDTRLAREQRPHELARRALVRRDPHDVKLAQLRGSQPRVQSRVLSHAILVAIAHHRRELRVVHNAALTARRRVARELDEVAEVDDRDHRNAVLTLDRLHR